MAESRDARYRELLLAPLRKCADYTPKFGRGGSGVDLDEFKEIYGSDPLYSWVGLDSPLMYAAHKAAGGMTSIYRQLGIGCEALFRAILRDEFGLTSEEAKWEYERPRSGGREGTQRLSLDGRIDLQHVADESKAGVVRRWIDELVEEHDIDVDIRGAVFEVRQGYKSKDAKRQNADLANASVAISKGYLPVLTIFSRQIDGDIRLRYEDGNWTVLSGHIGTDDTHKSTFAFSKHVVGFDLEQFFRSNHAKLQTEVESILKKLLEPK